MSIDFDQIIDRTGTSSLKWDRFPEDVIPLWVADMDFKSAPEIIDALHERIDHGIFGYTLPDAELVQLIVERCRNLYHWDIEPGMDCLVARTGVVFKRLCAGLCKCPRRGHRTDSGVLPISDGSQIGQP